MEQTLRRKVLLSWLILIFLQTAASQSSVMYMMSVSPTTRSEMQSSASSTPTMIVPDQTRGSEMQSSASSTLTIKVSNQTGGSESCFKLGDNGPTPAQVIIPICCRKNGVKTHSQTK
ncbi:uncharacterized protein [Acropora muricata]|uniref:uncharacterized protein isoform X2 n=1 Tax=Acropora muricata TaxID=159855 RepID=UPI0034E530DA